MLTPPARTSGARKSNGPGERATGGTPACFLCEGLKLGASRRLKKKEYAEGGTVGERGGLSRMELPPSLTEPPWVPALAWHRHPAE